jgi:UDP-N-acetyl-2-amino-2-deoxyglucuronate dehydrogenase
MLRTAIVGVGWAGQRQAQAIRELGRKVQIECLVDNDADFLREQAAELGIDKTYIDYHDALNDAAVDAVSICTPHDLHCPLALDAAATGKHILVEKPIAMTVEDATSMIEAAETNGVRLYVAENLCYTPMSRTLRQIVQSGQYIGELVSASFTGGFRASNFGYPGRRAWLTRPEQGGTGTWMLHGIHSMAQLRFVLGEVETVYLREHQARSFERPDIEGTMSGLLTLESGVPVAVTQTCEVNLRGSFRGYTLLGDAGTLRASPEGYEVFLNNADAPQQFTYPKQLLSDYAGEIEAFADYVAGVAEGPTTGYSERRSLAVVQGGYESARSGQPVNLKTRFPAAYRQTPSG